MDFERKESPYPTYAAMPAIIPDASQDYSCRAPSSLRRPGPSASKGKASGSVRRRYVRRAHGSRPASAKRVSQRDCVPAKLVPRARRARFMAMSERFLLSSLAAVAAARAARAALPPRRSARRAHGGHPASAKRVSCRGWAAFQASSCRRRFAFLLPATSPRRTFRRGRRRSVFIGQEQRGHAAVALGDDPKRILAEAFARLPEIDRMG